METFDFDYHFPSTEYPESGNRMQLGGSYMFASAPDAPDQRIITLAFDEMRYFLVAGVLSEAPFPAINFLRFENFWLRHKLWKTFIYGHPVYGDINCKFHKPLTTPKPAKGRPGVLEGFTVQLIEQP